MKGIIFLALSLFISLQSCTSQVKELKVGDAAPLFTLTDQNGKSFDVKDVIGKKKLVIYFYPKDESGTCTKEACAFRDSYVDYTNAGAMVIGINSESAETHKKFVEHHNLPFTILSDPKKQVGSAYGVKDLFTMTGRKTFVVDLNGKIAYTYDAVSEGEKHSVEALNAIKNMK